MPDKKIISNFFNKGVYSEEEQPKPDQIYQKLPNFDPENAQTFFEIAIGNEGDEDY